MSMKAWAEDERPREKLLQKGAAALSLSELFAILLRSGAGGMSAIELARRILADHRDDLNELAHSSIRELMNRYKGVGMAKAASIVAAIEIGRRRKPEGQKAVIRCSVDAYRHLRPYIADLDHEEFWVLYLSRGNRVKECAGLFSGGMEETAVDVRMLYRNALEIKASGLIIAHNHPGGTLSPSVQDKMITRKIYEAGNLLDIKLEDHIIIGAGGYYSFADEGLLGTTG